MKRLSALFLTLSLVVGCAAHIAPSSAPVTPPPTATQIVLKSLVRVNIWTPDGTYICTGFSIAPRKFLTAAHCTTPLHHAKVAILTVNERPAFVIKEDEVTDLSILVADLNLPSLVIRLEPLHSFPSIPENVKAAGFGYGFTSPLVTDHTVMILNYTIEEDIYPGTIYMNGFIGGMSGGPVFDLTGRVVGMVQRGTSSIGYGVDAVTILAFLGE